MNLLSTTTVFSFFTLISRILGYFRDILIAIFLGASIYADAFFVAFRLPNTFRRLFAEGTFNAAFIPGYSAEKLKSKKSGKKFADEVLALISLVLLFIVILAEIFTPFFVFLIAPGFIENNLKFELAIELTRITFPFLLLVSLSSFFSGILNSHNKFAVAAAAPIILNLLMIASIIFSYLYDNNYSKNLSYSVTFAGLLQLIFLIFFTRKYYKPSIKLKTKISNKVKFFVKRLLPSIFSSGVTQINILIGTIIASFQVGAVSYLYYADRIYQINLAIAGIAVSTVSLPILSSALKLRNFKKVHDIQNKSLELSLLLSVPAFAGLYIASEEIINALFGYGSFNIEDVRLTAEALKYFSFGIPAFAVLKIFANLFFARLDTKTPFYISIFMVFINVSISLLFFKKIGFIIIPIATSTSAWMGSIVYLYILSNKKYFNIRKYNIINLSKILLSTTAMSIFLIFAINFFNLQLLYSNFFKFGYLLFIVLSSAMIYLLTCNLLGVLKLNKNNYRV